MNEALEKVAKQLERIERLKVIETKTLDAISEFLNELGETGSAERLVIRSNGSSVKQHEVEHTHEQHEPVAVSAKPTKRKHMADTAGAALIPEYGPPKKVAKVRSFLPKSKNEGTTEIKEDPINEACTLHELLLNVCDRNESLAKCVRIISRSCPTYDELLDVLQALFVSDDIPERAIPIAAGLIEHTNEASEVLGDLLNVVHGYLILQSPTEAEGQAALLIAKRFAECCGAMQTHVWMAELMCYDAMCVLGREARLKQMCNETRVGMCAAILLGASLSDVPVMPLNRMWVLAGLSLVSDLFNFVPRGSVGWADRYLARLSRILGCNEKLLSPEIPGKKAFARFIEQAPDREPTFDDVLTLGIICTATGSNFATSKLQHPTVQAHLCDLTSGHTPSLAVFLSVISQEPDATLAAVSRSLLTVAESPNDVSTCALMSLQQNVPKKTEEDVKLMLETSNSIGLSSPEWLREAIDELEENVASG
eukprot:TRINITY_DN20983_c0_g1_i1.p1 TRINITY_DN20983_c0_g1~~TRINITY_DN20983_c0_g1_i1.p1  ORF type:complete len:481 (+),score=93.78 TRINITY_DN20983_c0_g1_i1:630-2072(+)